MKKIVFLLLALLCLPIGLMAQSNDDDLYFVPSKDKEESAPAKKEPMRVKSQTNVYVTPQTTVIYQDRKGNARDIDEYNRRYDARNNDFVMEDDTLYVQEKEQPDLDGEWVSGEFNGSQDDYEYAERIIRFRNPRYAVSISSPYYWDIVYGGNSWDWNVYNDGFYAYAFPTFSNPMWWDWRYNSWGRGWGSPYYSSWGYNPYHWGGYYGGYYGGGSWGHHHGGWYPGGGYGSHWAGTGTYYNNRRSSGRSDVVNSSRRSSIRTEGYRSSNSSTTRRAASDLRSSGNSTSRRVVGTRSSSERLGAAERLESSSSRRGTAYSRPSSTRSNSFSESGSTRRSSSSVNSTQRSSGSTYNRGSSDSPSRSYSTESSRRSSSNNNSSSSSRSSSRSSYSSGSSSGGSSYSGGGSSSRSSGGGGGGSSRSSRR